MKKKLFALALSAMLVLSLAACGGSTSTAAPAVSASSAPAESSASSESAAAPTAVSKITGVRAKQTPGYEVVNVPTDVISNDSDVVMNYIQEFANVTQVPHSSFNTEKITAYLKAWAENNGVTCETEEIGNVIMFLPATAGYEDAPTVVFQGHIDMVEAVDPGVTHDWTTDPLELVWSSNSVKANGTSLGADNGSGIAFMLTYMDYADQFVHGPLRFVFTVDEEVGLYGAKALDPKYLEGADYMINVDGGYGGAVISCAGGKYFDFSHPTEWVAVPADSVAYAVEFAGLKGGHSAGVGNGKANALVAVANAVLALDQAGVDVNIAAFSGGSANNAIPSSAKAVVTVKNGDLAAVDEAMQNFAKLFDDAYSAVETDYTFTYGKTDETVSRVLSGDLSVTLVQLMSTVPNNIHTLLATASGTESSSNLGTFSLTEDTVTFTCMMRSSSNYQSQQITMANQALSEFSGFSMEVPTTFATWPLKGGNKLGDIAAELFYDMTGEEYALKAIHAGVECGEFTEKNDSIYIISTGVSGGSEGHTTAESMNFDKVEVSIDFLVALAEKLATMK